MGTLLVPSEEMAGILEQDLEGRIEVMEDDGLRGTPDHEDAAAVAQLLREQRMFPATLELSDAETRQAFISLENVLNHADTADLNAAMQDLQAQGYGGR
jgi:hypothetical protein